MSRGDRAQVSTVSFTHAAITAGSASGASINVASLLAAVRTSTKSESIGREVIRPEAAARPARRNNSETVVPALAAASAINLLSAAATRNLINPPCMLALLSFGVHGAEPLKLLRGHVPHGLLLVFRSRSRSH
jgi:hypothetical protein